MKLKVTIIIKKKKTYDLIHETIIKKNLASIIYNTNMKLLLKKIIIEYFDNIYYYLILF